MDGLGLSVLNQQGPDTGSGLGPVGAHQHLSLSLGLNLPHVDHQLLSFDKGIGLMPKAPAIISQQVLGQNVIVESISVNSEATCSSYTLSNSASVVVASHQGERILDKKSYLCDKCQKDFQFEDMYAEHLRAYHKVLKPYSCHLCQETFRQKFSVNTHLRKEHNFDIPIKKAKIRKLANGLYACDLCENTYPKLSKAYSHRLRHFHKKHVCPYCDMSFFEYKNLKKHLTIHEKPTLQPSSVTGSKFVGGKRKMSSCRTKLSQGSSSCKKKVFCEECKKGFYNNYAMNLHVKINHEGIKPFTCDLCMISFCVKKSLELHKLKKHNIKPERALRKKLAKTRVSNGTEVAKKHLCEICSKQYISKYQFRLHQKTHLVETGQSFPCFLCEECFPEREAVTNHLREHHNLLESSLKFPKKRLNGLYVCDDTNCLKGFAKAHGYFEHRQECHGDRRFVCPICKKAFTKTTLFRNHLNIHNGVKPYLCLVCRVSFSTRTNLNLHSKTHFKTNPFYCAACNKTYATVDTFKTHKTMHVGKSPFMCEKCYKGFETHFELEKHQTWGHRDLKRELKCEFCNHSFISKSTLNKHMKSFCSSVDSSKLRKNNCQFCGKTYKHFSTLSNHVKNCDLNVHKELVIKPTTPRIIRQSIASSIKNVEDIEVMEGFICKNCFFPFSEQSLLFNHMKNEHPDLDIYNENILALYDKNNPPDFQLTDKYLSNQAKTDENNLQIRLINYICNICYNGIPYASKGLFLKHVEKFHPKYPVLDLIPKITRTNNDEPNQTMNNSHSKNIIEESKGNVSEDFNNQSYALSEKKKLRTSPRNKNKVETSQKPESSKKSCKLLENVEKSFAKIEHLCKVCGARYLSKSALDKHTLKLHSQDLPDIDNGDSESNEDSSDKILEDSTKKNEQKCKLCKIVYTKKYYFDKHIAKYHPDYYDLKPKSYIVNISETVKSSNKVKSLENFQCAICSVTYARRHNLAYHIRKLHSKEIVKKTCQSEWNVDDYIESPSSDSNPSYLVCEICQERYKVKGYLEAHIRKNHPDYWKEYHRKQSEKPSNVDPKPSDEEVEFSPDVEYYCKMCCLPYNLKKNLDRHVEKFHPDYYKIYPEDKPFEETFNQVVLVDNSDCTLQIVDVIEEPVNLQKPDILQQLADEITKDFDTSHNEETQNIENQNSHVKNTGYNTQGGQYTFEPNHVSAQYQTLPDNQNLGYINHDRPTYAYNNGVLPQFNNQSYEIPSGNHFSSSCNFSQLGANSQRVITEAVAYTYAKQNITYEEASFNSGAHKTLVETDFAVYNPNYTSANNPPSTESQNVLKSVGQNSDNEDYIVPDSGFDVSYDSDTCDDPKDNKTNINKHVLGVPFNELVEQKKTLDIKPLNANSSGSEPQIVLTEAEKAKGHFCKVCPMYYLRRIYLVKHYAKEHPTEKLLLAELNKIIKNEEKKKANITYTCHLCAKTFARKDFLRRHYKNLHFGERNFFCDICPASFTSNSNLQRHNEIHIKNPFLCEICHEWFKTKELLTEHEEFHENGTSCHSCENSFKDEAFLRRHEKKMHPELKKNDKTVVSKSGKKAVKRGRRRLRKSKTAENKDSEDTEEHESDSSKDDDTVKPAKLIVKKRRTILKRNAKRNATVKI